MLFRPNISRTFFERQEKSVSNFFVKQLSYRYSIFLNSITLKSNLIVSGIKWRQFAVKLHFAPFAGLFISKSRLSPRNKLMIIENKNTSGYEWCFDEGCEKSPSAVIFNHKF